MEEAAQKQKADILQKARSGKSRYITYIKVNPNLERSKIYDRNFVSTFKLQKVIRLRTVSHSLEIETGRHGRYRKMLEDRLCHCGEVESEEHFLLQCGTYDHLRKKYNVDEAFVLSDVLELNNIENYVNDLYETRLLYLT